MILEATDAGDRRGPKITMNNLEWKVCDRSRVGEREPNMLPSLASIT
jgi:hypothetical protein